MFRVELVPDSSTAPTPGWRYVTDHGFDPAKAAMAPALGRKRGIRDARKGGDISSRRANAIVRHIAELDRENHRDVQIPVPVRQAKEAGTRGTRAKTTSNVRRILQSQKTFRNHLDDEEAAIAASGGGGMGSIQGSRLASTAMIPKPSYAAKGSKASVVATSSRRSSTPAIQPKRGLPADPATSSSTPTPSQSGTTDADVADGSGPKPKLFKTEHDDDPLLCSYSPTMPSDRVIQLLLAEPPLSYNASRVGPPLSAQLPRYFCCMCGYWGKIRCKSCHLRTCGLDCYRMHEDSRCGAFF